MDMEKQGEKEETHEQKKKEEQKKAIVAPIIVREKYKWTEISKKMAEQKINYPKAREVRSGIEKEPETEVNYRRMFNITTSKVL